MRAVSSQCTVHGNGNGSITRRFCSVDERAGAKDGADREEGLQLA